MKDMRKLNMQKPEQRPENNHSIKPLKDLNLIDFLHYVEQSSDERIPQDGDERLLKEEARAEGKAEGKAEIIANMLRRNMPEEDICAIAECSPEFVAGVREKL